MKVVSLTVENFRSITAARRIPISQLTTLVGPNNEGKSNILRAFIIGMRHILSRRRPTTGWVLWTSFLTRSFTARRQTPAARRRAQTEDVYSWERDFPIKLQKVNAEKGSKIILEFLLDEEETTKLNKEIGFKLTTPLAISIEFTQSGDELVTIPEQNPTPKRLTTVTPKIIEFVANRLEIQYIPAVRTAQSAQEIVGNLVQRELSKIEADEKYKQALADIAALQEPILEALSDNVTTTMKEFLLDIVNAKVVIREQDRSYALRGISEIVLNDGAETSLSFKGDGVQSLAAIALMRYASQSQHEGKEVLIALEEPESSSSQCDTTTSKCSVGVIDTASNSFVDPQSDICESRRRYIRT